VGTKKVKWICRWCLLRSNSSWVFSSFFVFFHYTSVINSSEDKISCWGNLTSFALKDRHLFCSLLLVKKFHESLVPMQGLNMERGIDFGFNSSRFCKFKGISREHGKNLLLFWLLETTYADRPKWTRCTYWAMMDEWMVSGHETIFCWIQLS